MTLKAKLVAEDLYMIRCLEIEPALMILKEKSASTSQENVINPKNVEEEINMIAGDLKEDFIM